MVMRMSCVAYTQVQRLKRSYRVQDLVVSHTGAVAVIADNDAKLHLLRLSDHREVTLPEVGPIMAITLSRDSRCARLCDRCVTCYGDSACRCDLNRGRAHPKTSRRHPKIQKKSHLCMLSLVCICVCCC